MAKHTREELKQMQSLPLEIKIRMTERRIREWYEHYQGQVYVSFSGGKDSTVLADIVRNRCGLTDVPLVFVDTGLEYPEIRDFVKEYGEKVVWLKPKKNFKQVINEYGYPFFSKEVSNNIDGARRYIKILTDRQTDRQTDEELPSLPYSYNYRRICGVGEYSKRRFEESERLSQKIEHNARNVKYSQPNRYP